MGIVCVGHPGPPLQASCDVRDVYVGHPRAALYRVSLSCIL